MTIRNTPSGGAAALGCLAILVTVILGPILNGLVLSVLWGWFVAQTFGVATLGIANAIGLSILANSLLHHGEVADDEARKAAVAGKTMTSAITTMLSKAFLAPLMTLLVAWIVTLFM